MTAETGPNDTASDKEMPFLEHLIELRARILRSFALIGILFIPIYYYAGPLFSFVAAPLVQALPDGSSMIATQVTSPFLTPFKLAIYTAVFIGVPFLLHQLWAFVSPGLYRSEKRFAFPLLFSSVVLFYAGMAFSYFLVFPLVFDFLAMVSPEGVPMMTDINHYLDFVLKMFLAFGIAFEIPVATFLLAWSGLSSADKMASKRPYVIIGCFIAGMLLTPPDVVSQLLLALPTWVLFEFGVLMARLVERRNANNPSDADDEPQA
ncbi:MAG: twin-arginine translocase subunit TatC [Pseudomonadales bacterium]|jgi:sec-independent protein translocase protein TatC|nr:twin-arginine translocase subunit TatC [Pseudomonadales bacterium]